MAVEGGVDVLLLFLGEDFLEEEADGLLGVEDFLEEEADVLLGVVPEVAGVDAELVGGMKGVSNVLKVYPGNASIFRDF